MRLFKHYCRIYFRRNAFSFVVDMKEINLIHMLLLCDVFKLLACTLLSGLERVVKNKPSFFHFTQTVAVQSVSTHVASSYADLLEQKNAFA